MGMFGKGKEKIEKALSPPSPEDVEVSVVSPALESKKEDGKAAEASKDDVLKLFVESFKAYDGVFTPQDVGNMSLVEIRTIEFNLQFAVFCELVKLNKSIKE